MCCSQLTWAGIVIKQAKTKNSTNVMKEVIPTTKHPKLMQKVKTTTTTLKPEVETVKPFDEDLDGRSAFINNQYVADEDPITDDTPPLYEILQQQMESVLSNTGNNVQVYPDTAQLKAIMEEGEDNEGDKQKPPGKPIFSYDMHQFDEYDEEDTGVEDTTDTEEQPDNCEDTEESLTDNDDVSPQASNAYQNLLQNNYGPSTLAQNSQQNNPNNRGENSYDSPNSYDSSNYAALSNSNRESSYNNYQQSPQGHAIQDSHGQSKPLNQHQTIHKSSQSSAEQTKTKPSTGKIPTSQSQKSPYNNNEEHAKPLVQNKQTNEKPSSSNNNPKPQQSTKPHRHSSKSPQNSKKPNKTPIQNSSSNQNTPQGNTSPDIKKTVQNNHKIINNGNSISPAVPNSTYGNSNPALLSTPNSSNSVPNPSNGNLNPSTLLPSNTSSLSPPYPNSSYGSLNSSPLSALNTLHDNPNPALTSPFSTTSETNKFPNTDPRRRLTFRTVSSSTQFVSTPLADLMFKFSIGMSKPSRSGNDKANNQAQIYNKNDLEKS